MDETKGGDTPGRESSASEGSSSAGDQHPAQKPKRHPLEVDWEKRGALESSSTGPGETAPAAGAEQSSEKAVNSSTGESSQEPDSEAGTEDPPSASKAEIPAPEPPAHKPIYYPEDPDEPEIETKPVAKTAQGGGSGAPPQPPATSSGGGDDGGDDEEWDEEDGMLRMSFMDHLEELRMRIIRVLIGAGVAFLIAVAGAIPLWNFVQAPLREAVSQYGGEIVALSPGEQFSIIWMWSPLVAAIFMAAPWVIYQIWAFVAPGLYPNERRWAAPFIIITAGLFIGGGAFAYYIAFRYALVFLLGIGAPADVLPLISIERYFSMFVNVMLGVSLLFELPVIVFFLTLLRITTPGFLLRNARYAVLAIVVLAAVVTPTPDPVNLTLFAIPMILLFFLGVFASYLLVLHREGQRFPWKAFFIWLSIVVLLLAVGVAFAIGYYGYQLQLGWPLLIR